MRTNAQRAGVRVQLASAENLERDARRDAGAPSALARAARTPADRLCSPGHANGQTSAERAPASLMLRVLIRGRSACATTLPTEPRMTGSIVLVSASGHRADTDAMGPAEASARRPCWPAPLSDRAGGPCGSRTASSCRARATRTSGRCWSPRAAPGFRKSVAERGSCRCLQAHAAPHRAPSARRAARCCEADRPGAAGRRDRLAWTVATAAGGLVGRGPLRRGRLRLGGQGCGADQRGETAGYGEA